MKRNLLATTLVILAMTLLFTLSSCELGSDDTPSLISTTEEETTTPPPETTTQHVHAYSEVVTSLAPKGDIPPIPAPAAIHMLTTRPTH